MVSSLVSTEQARKGPVLRVTGHDRASALVIAAVLGLLLTVAFLVVAWASQHEWESEEVVPLEVVDIAGGVLDGSETETLELKTPFEEMPDPSLAEIRSDETLIKPMLDSVMDLADQATDMAQQQRRNAIANTGRPGSRSGTGEAALGLGSGLRGFPREERWFVRFNDGDTTQIYARELDSFGIELGALLPGGTLVYLSNLAAETPTVRRTKSGAGEERLYFTWVGGGRRTADFELFRKAGIDVGGAPIFHFYPQETENKLARLELDYDNRAVKDIRRTYFAVQRRGSRFEFVVTRQVYFR